MIALEERTMLDIEEVAEQLGLSVGAVKRLARLGKLRAYRIGRRLKFKPEDITAYVEASVYQPKPRDEGEDQR